MDGFVVVPSSLMALCVCGHLHVEHLHFSSYILVLQLRRVFLVLAIEPNF